MILTAGSKNFLIFFPLLLSVIKNEILAYRNAEIQELAREKSKVLSIL
jgi:hypothetical protein